MEVIVSKNELTSICAKQFIKVGVPENHAYNVAEILVHADLRGVHSHGVMRTMHYIKRIKSGGININPKFKIDEKSSAVALLDGDDGLGHVIAKEAMEEAIKRAKDNKIAMVGVINSSHCGALSYYVKMAAEQGFIGIALSHTDKVMVPYGGAESYFGTNPIAFGVPAKKYKPIILDMATSEVAFGKILHARNIGSTIPEHWGVDEEGNPTTDPNKVKSLVPFGGPKGYGLAMMIDILSGILTGSAFGPYITPMYGDYDKMRKLGHLFIAIDTSVFIEKEDFLNNIDKMITDIHQVKPAPGFERVMIPGEPEQLKEDERLINGIPIPEEIYKQLISIE
ncbi:ureidoglycolate dehydrogenase (NAD+) [Anaerobranca californiensis DSM 14826]|uniref:Ureidoglycolate dehydrogenase (NAD+) n=1 Tax=Anaerobranca californiensis DSM 14826 TaxID=1120989 RepID=A0A1M6K7G5_9FIRM|nr:ureidoglycolate dehydrogenase [Anaerobranca californiensis]SHJ54864.1 ureidoglycolate dehydrogenase (NAD+) [Anaerobranca californiensis DSM 14826]